MKNEKSKKRLKLFTWPLICIALMGGIISYIQAGCSTGDAVFKAIELFKFEYDEEYLNMGIRIFRWIAPASVATTLFSEIKPLFLWIRNKYVSWTSSERTIIYSDSDAGETLYNSMVENGKKVVLVKESELSKLSYNAKSSIIIMKNDEDALKLYRCLNEIGGMKDKTNYLCLNSMEPSLMPSSGNTVICNINDIIAGYFWHKDFMRFSNEKDKNGILAWRMRDNVHIFKNDKSRKFEVVIWGYDNLGKRILYKGLLANIFSPFQRIIYHIYDPDNLGAAYKDEIEGAVHSMVGDDVIFYSKDEQRALRGIADRMDAVILPIETEPDKLQELLYTTTKPEVYYYDPKGIKLETVFSQQDKNSDLYNRLHSFGADREMFKEDYILHSHLIKDAKELNKDYCIRNPEKGCSWEDLSGFAKGANVNCADFREIGRTVALWEGDYRKKDSCTFREEDLCVLEHIRWSRYVYLNHMSENEDKKKLLKPYVELSREEKAKDLAKVRRWEFDYRIVEPGEFDKNFDESHDELKGAKYCYVNDRNVEEYRDCTCIMFVDEEDTPEAYVAVDPKGVIGSVLKDKDSDKREFLFKILYVAFEYGGNKLDCYKDDKNTLPYNYADAGFIPVCRIHFDRSQVGGDWCPEAGTPDVVFMFFMDEGIDYYSYRDWVRGDKYPRFDNYKYIPYVEELFDRFPDQSHEDIYAFAEYVRDFAADLWKKQRDDFKGRETEFVRHILGSEVNKGGQ